MTIINSGGLHPIQTSLNNLSLMLRQGEEGYDQLVNELADIYRRHFEVSEPIRSRFQLLPTEFGIDFNYLEMTDEPTGSLAANGYAITVSTLIYDHYQYAITGADLVIDGELQDLNAAEIYMYIHATVSADESYEDFARRIVDAMLRDRWIETCQKFADKTLDKTRTLC